MRHCQSCNDPIEESRRKDARFCTKPGCRARDFRRRKREQAIEHPIAQLQKPNESVVITCSCGNRLLVQVTHLGPAEPRSAESTSSGESDLCAGTQPAAAPSATEATLHQSTDSLVESSPPSDSHDRVTEISAENPIVQSDSAITQVTTLSAAVREVPLPQEHPAPGLSESTAVTRTVPSTAISGGPTQESLPQVAPSPVIHEGSVAPNGSRPALIAETAAAPQIQKPPQAMQKKVIAVARTVPNAASPVAVVLEAPVEPEPLAANSTPPAESHGALAVPTKQTIALEVKAPLPSAPVVTPSPSPQQIEFIPGHRALPPGPASLVQRTCELMGSVGGSRLVPLNTVLRRYRDGSVSLAPGVELHLCIKPHEGHGLSGVPGCWREFYPDSSPTEFGQDADLAVVGWDAHAGRAFVIHANMLRQLLGNNWRDAVRATINRYR